MVTERLTFGPVNSGSLKEKKFAEEQTHPIFEKEGKRRVYKHPLFSYYPDDNDRFILRGENIIHLTRRENSIFKRFVENVNQVISHAELEQKGIRISDEVFRQYIGRLRTKINRITKESQIIYTVGEKRYMLYDPSRLSEEQDLIGFVYRPRRHSVEARDNHEVFLTVREKKLLDFLITHLGEVAERDAIAKTLYEDKKDITRRIDKCIQGLRKKIGDFKQEDGTFRFIVLVHGKGYKLTKPAVAA